MDPLAKHLPLQIHTAADLADASQWAALRFVSLAEQAIADRDRFVVALSGGGTPRGLYEALGQPDHAAAIDWGRVHFLFSDERCVPPEDAQSNYGMARKALLSKVPIPEGNVARMRGELDPRIAAANYAMEISRLYPEAAPAGGQWPQIDLVLLGMGPDGHTASLFPRTDALKENRSFCVANYIKKLDSWRLTITRPMICEAENVWLLVCGTDKAEIVNRVVTGRRQLDLYPVQLVFNARGQVIWVLDQASAAQLPEELRRGNVQ
jgi:6-phosphogluconolactonase